MPIIPIPFGEGLQRSDGVMVVAPNTFKDLWNVYQFEGKAQARKGIFETSVLIDDLAAELDATLQIHASRAEQAGLGVGFDAVTYEMWLNRISIDGGSPTVIGSLGTPPANGLQFDPPIVHMADSDNKVFIAHDEPNIGARLPTQFFNPFSFPQIQTLQADLLGSGEKSDVLFRGVTRHLSYIFGWGYGNEDDRDRGDVVRVSNSANPTIFQDFAFFEVGQRAEPVMTAKSAGRSLLVFKETETYEIFGYSPDTFGIRPADMLFGCVGSRLAVEVAGSVFFWSSQGPRVSTGQGPSTDIGVPLDIEGPDPSGLPDESDVENAFAAYDPRTRTVLFVWGQRVYALSIRDPNRPRWSYYQLGTLPQCAGQLFTTQTSTGGIAPTGYPGLAALEGGSIVEGDDDTELVLEWSNNGLTGGEIVEIRYSDDGGTTYQAAASVIASGATQKHTVPGLVANTTYKFSLRYQRGGLYTTTDGDWSSTNPDEWDDPNFRGQNTASTGISTPVPVERGENNGTWQVTGSGVHEIEFEWTIPAGNEGLEIEIERRIRTEGDVTVQDVDGRGIGPPDSGADATPTAFTNIATVAAGTTKHKDSSPTAHRWHDYRLRFPGGAYSSVLSCWAGPDAPAPDSFEANGNGADNFIPTEWTNATAPTGRSSCPGDPPSSHQTQGFFNNRTLNPGNDGWATGGSPDSAFDTTSGILVSPTPASNDTPIRCAVRHQVTCFGTVYPSYWARITATPNYVETTAGTTE